MEGAVPAPTVDVFSLFSLFISCQRGPFVCKVSSGVGFFLGTFSSLSRAAFSNLSTGVVDERVDVKGSERGTGGASVGVSPRPGPRGPVAPGVRGMLEEGARKLSRMGGRHSEEDDAFQKGIHLSPSQIPEVKCRGGAPACDST